MKFRFVFAVAMIAGNRTFYDNLKRYVSREEDIEAHWLPVGPEFTDWYTRIPPFSLHWGTRVALFMKRQLRHIQKAAGQPNCILFHHQALAYGLRTVRRSVPYIVTLDVTPALQCHQESWYRGKSLDFWPLKGYRHSVAQAVYRGAFRVLPFSDWAASSVQKDYSIDSKSVEVVPPGVDLSLWQGIERSRGARPLRVLFVGGDAYRKGGDLLAQIASDPDFAHVNFHIVTQSNLHSPAANIQVHRSVLPNSDELRQLYRESDVFVLPTRADYHSWVVLEAMASGLPVITTGVGALPEIVEHGRTGFIIQPDDKPQLKARLYSLLQNPDLRLRFGCAGRKRVEERFSLEVNAKRTVEIMRQAATQGSTLHC